MTVASPASTAQEKKYTPVHEFFYRELRQLYLEAIVGDPIPNGGIQKWEHVGFAKAWFFLDSLDNLLHHEFIAHFLTKGLREDVRQIISELDRIWVKRVTEDPAWQSSLREITDDRLETLLSKLRSLRF